MEERVNSHTVIIFELLESLTACPYIEIDY